MSGTRRVTSYAYTSLSVFPSEQLSICLKMSLFHRHFTAVFTRLAVVFFSRTKWMVPPSSGFALSSEVSCQPDNPWKVIYLLFLETAFVFCSCNLLCNGMIFFFFFSA